MIQVYKNKKTGVIFRTNYFDYFNGYMMCDTGLVKFNDKNIIPFYVKSKEFKKLKIIK